MTRHSPEQPGMDRGRSLGPTGSNGGPASGMRHEPESRSADPRTIAEPELHDERSEQLARRVVAVLDGQARDLPEAVITALATARQRAMEQAERSADDRVDTGRRLQLGASAGQSRSTSRHGLWIGSLAAGLMALGLVLLLPERHAEPGVDQLLALAEVSDGEWEAVQDLEFALWLSELPDEALDDDQRG